MADLPAFYDPNHIGNLFYPDVAAIAQSAEEAALPIASDDETRVLLLLIDMQVDFCHERGALYVPGAPGDIRRLIEYLYENAERITHVTASLDSHYPFQIFHPAWWVDAQGRPPPPMTTITADEVEAGKWIPRTKPEWSREYVKKLQAEAKKELLIWPYHVPLGGVGNALDPELWSAVFWHAVARKSQPTWWSKGSHPLTEHYSVVRPEIPVPDQPQEKEKDEFLNSLEGYDAILVAGEAASHCVQETLEDLVELYADRPEQIRKLHLLRDCTSPVQHPEIDFAAMAEKQFEEFEKKGVRFVRTTDPFPC